jgi:DegV family protein with EDD domain
MVIKVVTDSTCDLPADVINELDIVKVPLYINIGEKGYLDGIDISRKEFYTNLPNYPVHPTTGTPGTETFNSTYQSLLASGADHILSIHISENLSATVNVAQKTAENYPNVTVIDSGQLSLGTGFQVELAAKMAAVGAKLDDILQTIKDLGDRTFVTAGLDTLEFLRRSGRMNRFMSGLGSLLQLKPILTMKNGQPGSDRVRTSLKAEKRLISLLEDNLPIEKFALLHTNAQEKAQSFLNSINHLLPKEKYYSMDITPVIGAHIGPGAFGYAIITDKNK